MRQDQLHYDTTHIDFLEKLWGDGFMSPGGHGEIQRLLMKTSLLDRKVLDIGCGAGGITISLLRDFQAKMVIGVDVESDVLKKTKDKIKRANLEEKIKVFLVGEGKLPFKADTFDIVFSKDSIVHVPDKEAIFNEVSRVLVPGGIFVFSDWLISHDNEPSPEMKYYLELEDLGFGMASPIRYEQALKNCGFRSIEVRNRNSWYRNEARRELNILSGSDRKSYEKLTSKEFIKNQIMTWEAMITVLDSGEHCPHHFRAIKPNKNK